MTLPLIRGVTVEYDFHFAVFVQIRDRRRCNPCLVPSIVELCDELRRLYLRSAAVGCTRSRRRGRCNSSVECYQWCKDTGTSCNFKAVWFVEIDAGETIASLSRWLCVIMTKNQYLVGEEMS